MEEAEQYKTNEITPNALISVKYLYWIIIIYGLVSFLRAIGIGFTYIDYLAPGNVYVPFIANLGNFLVILSTIFAIPTLLLVIVLILKKVSFSIILVPLLYILLPFLQILIAIISLAFFGVPLYNSEFSNTFLVRVILNNYFVMIYYLIIVFCSIIIIKKNLSKE